MLIVEELALVTLSHYQMRWETSVSSLAGGMSSMEMIQLDVPGHAIENSPSRHCPWWKHWASSSSQRQSKGLVWRDLQTVVTILKIFFESAEKLMLLSFSCRIAVVMVRLVDSPSYL
jgi:hypothetical protein